MEGSEKKRYEETYREPVARIHSIETFGTVDGPGIRYVIFFQGCPLRCKYCHNRDTWDGGAGRTITLTDLTEDIEKYVPYFTASGGGVTATGGEPLLQAEFLVHLFDGLHERGIRTALDTSGFTELTPTVRRLLGLTDLVLLDLKHMDDEIHRKLTGVSNTKILRFARYLSDSGIPAWIRHVVVSGYTENLDSASRLASFVSGLSNVEKVELLPYHAMGAYKWEAFGSEYELADVVPPSSETIATLKSLFEAHSILVTWAA